MKRLEQARLFLPGAGGVNTTALLKLLVHGVPYVFPGRLGAETRGVPTAHSGPALAEHLPAVDAGRARDRRLAEEALAREFSQQGARCG